MPDMWVPRRVEQSAFISLVVASVITAYGADLMQRSGFTGRRVTSVRFEPPTQPLTQSQLDRYFPLRTGSDLTEAGVRAAIKSLYATGRYADVEVDAEPSGGGFGLIIHTTEQWFLGPVEVRGKVKLPPNLGQLTNATRLELGAPYSEADLHTAVQGVQNLLERNGLYGSTIEPRITRDSKYQQVSIVFAVNTRKRERLTKPTISGDTRIPPETVAKAAKYKGLFKWKPATNDNIQAGVRNIHGKYEKQDRFTADIRLTRRDYDPATNTVKQIG